MRYCGNVFVTLADLRMKWIINCDGSIQGGNPGGWACGGWVCKSVAGEVLDKGAVDLGLHSDNTNNIAEYAAVKSAIQYVVNFGPERPDAVLIRTDSKLVVMHLTKKWRCNKDTLRAYRDTILSYAEELLFEDTYVSYEWVPRRNNSDADAQSRIFYENSKD